MKANIKQTLAASIALCLALTFSAAGDDWPMLGRDATRNSVSPEENPPTNWDIGKFDRKVEKWFDARNIKWTAPLGSYTFGDPVVANGLVWVGTNNSGINDASVLACFREMDGKLLYRYVSPRLRMGKLGYQRIHDWAMASLANSPLVEGDRLWFVTNRCEVVCLDIGPLRRGVGEPKVAWKLDMIKQLDVFPIGSVTAWTRTSSVASYRDRLYVVTGNGASPLVNESSPESPSLICLNKDDGKLFWRENSPGKNILSGQWASPLVAEIEGKAQVIVPQGDGWLRSFDAMTSKLIWKFDMNHKAAKWLVNRRGDRNTILATPVFYDGNIYVAVGQNPEHGEGRGRLCCIDPTRRGDISSELAVSADGKPIPHRRIQAVDAEKGEKAIANPDSGLIWEFTANDENGNGKIDFEEAFHRTVSSVTIKNGLVIAVDFSGLVHCFDAKTGRRHWAYDNLAQMYATPLIIGNKVYVADSDGDIAIFNLSANPKVVMKESDSGLHPINARLVNRRAEVTNMHDAVQTSPIFANGTLYIAGRETLFAIESVK